MKQAREKASAELRISLLGGFRVEQEGKLVPDAAWRRRNARMLVKMLAAEPSHRLHREQVIDALWPESDLAAGQLGDVLLDGTLQLWVCTNANDASGWRKQLGLQLSTAAQPMHPTTGQVGDLFLGQSSQLWFCIVANDPNGWKMVQLV